MATGRPAGRPPKPVEARTGHRTIAENKTNETNLVAFDIPKPLQVLNRLEKVLWAYIWEGGKSYLKPERDRLSVQTTVSVWADYISELAKLRKEGYVISVTTGNGFETPKRNERQLVVKDLLAQLNTQLSTLGFSPADANRLQLSVASDDKQKALNILLTKNRGEK